MGGPRPVRLREAAGRLLDVVLRIEEVHRIELEPVLGSVLSGTGAWNTRAPARSVGRRLGLFVALLSVQQEDVAVQARLRRRTGPHVGDELLALEVDGGQLLAKAVDVVLGGGGRGGGSGVCERELVELDVPHKVVAVLGPLLVALGGCIRVGEDQGEAVVAAYLVAAGAAGARAGRGALGAGVGVLVAALLVVVREVQGEVDNGLLLGVRDLEGVAHGDLLVAVLVLDHQEALRSKLLVVDHGGDDLALVQRILDRVGNGD